MGPHNRGSVLETKVVMIGYAMSRLDMFYLRAMGCRSWKSAYQDAGKVLGVRPNNLKNLRDEFDPFHENRRQGWHKRPLRPNRQRVMGELCDMSDEALIELARRILVRDDEATNEIMVPLMVTPRPVQNVAERLLTGKRAEDYFLENCRSAIGVARRDILDFRNAARGFDFGVRGRPSQAVEVKGLKLMKGDVLFTDREWNEAKIRARDYWLIVVGNLVESPVLRVLQDPHSLIVATCRYQSSIATVWRSTIDVAG